MLQSVIAWAAHADGVHERRDVVLLDDTRQFRAVAGGEIRDGLADHARSLWSRRRRMACTPSSTRSSRSSNSTICFATAVSWDREARLSVVTACSSACSPAFLNGAWP